MSKSEQIITINGFCESVYKEKASSFIAQAYPVVNQKEADEIIELIRKKYFDASHHCYSYNVSDSIEKYSDDGEPSGSAGLRIRNAIDHFGLTNILVVVIRYFGGTKLGIGPLGKAYYQAAIQVLEKSDKINQFLVEKILINIDYSYISQLYKIVSDYKGKIETAVSEGQASFQVILSSAIIKQFEEQVINSTKGSCTIIRSGDLHYITN